jgi:hypothetical protein
MNILRYLSIGLFILCPIIADAQSRTSVQIEFNVSQYSQLEFEQQEFLVTNIIRPLKFGTIQLTNNNIEGFQLSVSSYDDKRNLGSKEDMDFDQVEGLNFVHYSIECKQIKSNTNTYIQAPVIHGSADRLCIDTESINERTVEFDFDTYLELTNAEELIHYETGYNEDIIVFTLADK